MSSAPTRAATTRQFMVTEKEAGRADHIVSARFPGTSRAQLAQLFAARLVRVDGSVAKKGTFVRAGSTMRLERSPTSATDLLPGAQPDAPLQIVHEDPDVVCLLKPAGLPTHPLRQGELGTLANALVARYPECLGVGHDPREAGLAHRLDTGTSGLILAARNQKAWLGLREAFGKRTVGKGYLALVEGTPEHEGCDAALRHRGKHMEIVSDKDPEALPASTTWKVRETFSGYSLLECHAVFGRMHQVRVHLAASGNPIVGDQTYGGPPAPGDTLLGHFLHAESLTLQHPMTHTSMRLVADLPEDRLQILVLLRDRH